MTKQHTIDDSQLIDADDIASLLKVSTRQVRRLKSAGTLPKPIKIGRLTRWRHADVQAWIEAGCPQTKPKR
jgi:excisionase family DNA binding protein